MSIFFKPGNVLEVLWQEIFCAGDNVERLRAISAVTYLQVLVSDTNQPPVVALEHVRVQGGQHGHEQLAVGGISWKRRRCEALPKMQETFVGEPGGDQDHTSLLVRQQVGDPGVWVFQNSVLTIGILLVIDIGHVVDIQDVERLQPVLEHTVQVLELLCVREVHKHNLLLTQPEMMKSAKSILKIET